MGGVTGGTGGAIGGTDEPEEPDEPDDSEEPDDSDDPDDSDEPAGNGGSDPDSFFPAASEASGLFSAGVFSAGSRGSDMDRFCQNPPFGQGPREATLVMRPREVRIG